MKLPSDPTENRTEHCKVYVEPSVKKAIQDYQISKNLDSFSDAGRELWLSALAESRPNGIDS
jgi:hypothetical protein